MAWIGHQLCLKTLPPLNFFSLFICSKKKSFENPILNTITGRVIVDLQNGFSCKEIPEKKNGERRIGKNEWFGYSVNE